MSATIKDIAKLVGVSPSTVSRVINGTASISEKTKQKIHDAMKELDYHPNSLARSLANGNTFTIGLVIDAGDRDAFSNAFFIQSVSAIETVTQDKGYNLLITNNANYANHNTVRNLVYEHKVEGIILPVSAMNEELVELMSRMNVPFVVMGEPETFNENISWVDVDNCQGGELAVEYLTEKGYRYPILFVENKGTVFEKKRSQGFRRGCEKSGIDRGISAVVECGSEDCSIHMKLKEIISKKIKLDSIICTNNFVAYRVLKELKELGKRVPEDVGVITFDNYPLAEFMDPPLSAVNVDTFRLGEKAALNLFEQIAAKERHEAEHTLIKTGIIERKSTCRRREKE